MRPLPTVPRANQFSTILERAMPLGVEGRVRAIRGTTIVCGGLPTPIGSLVQIFRRQGETLDGEVVGFDGGATIVAPLGPMEGVSQGDGVRLFRTIRTVPTGEDLIGRVLDATGTPMDDLGVIPPNVRTPCDAMPVPALERPPIDKILPTGVRAIDAFLTLGYGQRLGVFAGSGVGKSTLLGMLARGTQSDVVVIGLIGERGREVREFIERDLTDSGRKKAVVVVATSDTPAPRRILAAKTATAIAESFRDSGKNVLLLMDSVTRFAMAQREVGLAAGEVPTTRGYPPSVFAMLPQLVERSGNANRGSITAIYTVLVEGDDPNEPISDALRGLLDGHLYLSREIGARGRYPAIDILNSLSRLQNHLIDDSMRRAVMQLRASMAIYQENEDLINIGAYNKGSNPIIDQAIEMRPRIESFLSQPQSQTVRWEEMLSSLMGLVEQPKLSAAA